MLSRLFGKGSKGSSKGNSEAAPLSPALTKSILDAIGLKAIPVMPQSAHRLFLLTTNPKAEAHDFIEVIESDESLSARILKIGNSVYFDRGRGCKSIPDAVGIIGMAELRCLLHANTLSDLFPSRHRLRTQLWANDVATGVTAKLLAQRVAPAKCEQAFLAGLIHDIGKLLLLQRHQDTYEKIARRVAAKGMEFREVEIEEYPFDHTEVGQLIAEKWLFSSELIAAIRNHHMPWSDLAPQTLPWFVKAADTLSHSLGLGHGPDLAPLRAKFRENVNETWEALNIHPEERSTIENAIRNAYDSECEIYNSWSPPR